MIIKQLFLKVIAFTTSEHTYAECFIGLSFCQVLVGGHCREACCSFYMVRYRIRWISLELSNFHRLCTRQIEFIPFEFEYLQNCVFECKCIRIRMFRKTAVFECIRIRVFEKAQLLSCSKLFRVKLFMLTTNMNK